MEKYNIIVAQILWRGGAVLIQIEARRQETALSNPVIFWVTFDDKYFGIVLMTEPRLI